ncbi:MAG: dihydroxyacetone kinase subunit L [Lachnospiraceae bacterium]|nr:dihydroxyacetone kinase subunit L [Lachnospiraceae bacterium]
MDRLSIEQVRDMLLFTAHELIGKRDELTRIDAQIGDGDHGIGMENGFRSLISAVEGHSFDTINQLYREAGMAMLNSMGGASGVIFSSLFLQGVKGMENFDCMTSSELVNIWSNGLASIKKRGGAQKGDKTMVDALEPAVEILQALEGREQDMTVLMEKASEAAKEGMESTKQFEAKFGRAKSLMERAIGYQDAGATSTYFIIDSMYKYLLLEDEKQEKSNDAKRTRIVIGCDNAAIDLKLPIVEFLKEKGVIVEDVGCDAVTDITTYPKIAERVCRKIQESNYQKRGILLCGTGIGMAITANKFKGIRAAVCHDAFSAERSVLSNDCNILCMGERVIGVELAKKNLKEWLELKFVPGPSSAKINDISLIESENMK